MYFYAILDKDNICIGISQLSGVVKKKNMIKIDKYSEKYLGMVYVDEKWENKKEKKNEQKS